MNVRLHWEDPNSLTKASRRYDLDWLRVIAFGLLIFYHVGMFYVPWDWHVKSQNEVPGLAMWMSLINPWRLALLFFISGVAVRFATDKASTLSAFAGSRVLRLGLPVLFGLVVLVMPQAWFELRQSGELEGSFLKFYASYLAIEQQFTIITPTWNHLWYLVYLLSYILVICPFLPLVDQLNKSTHAARAFSSPLFVLTVLILPFVAVEIWLAPHFPVTHALIDDWAHHAHRFMIFLLGIIVARQPQFWTTVAKMGPLAALVIMATLSIRLMEDLIQIEIGAVLPATITDALFAFNGTLYAWSSILGLLWFAIRYLDRDSRLLRYLTGSVFFYYLIHQTVIIAAGYYLTQLGIGALPEFILLTLITIMACGAGREMVRFLPGIGIFLGVKQGKRAPV